MENLSRFLEEGQLLRGRHPVLLTPDRAAGTFGWRACSACPGDYEDPERNVRPPKPDDAESDQDELDAEGDEFPADVLLTAGEEAKQCGGTGNGKAIWHRDESSGR